MSEEDLDEAPPTFTDPSFAQWRLDEIREAHRRVLLEEGAIDEDEGVELEL